MKFLYALKLTILLCKSWKWISQTFSADSSDSKVTNPKPENNSYEFKLIFFKALWLDTKYFVYIYKVEYLFIFLRNN